MQKILVSITLLMISVACRPESSENKVSGLGKEAYVCPLPTGEYSYQLNSIPLEGCTKVADLTEEEALQVAEAVDHIDKSTINNGSLVFPLSFSF